MSGLFADRCGLASTPPAEVGASIVRAWDRFLAHVDASDLDRPTRLGISGRELCVHMGTWEDHQVLSGLVAAAKSGGGPDPDRSDPDHTVLRAAHVGDDVRAALQRSREETVAWFAASEEPQALGRHRVNSSVGVLPLLSVLHAGCYELAVHALDLGGDVASDLLQEGLAALMDVTGALAAASGVDLTVTAQTPDGGWAFTSDADGWSVSEVAPGPVRGVGVTGTATDLLDASAGRAQVPSLLLQRRLKVHDLPSFMRLAPLLNDVPGLPGGAALRVGVNGVAAVTGGVGRLLSRFRG
jgi:hypothetical protein